MRLRAIATIIFVGALAGCTLPTPSERGPGAAAPVNYWEKMDGPTVPADQGRLSQDEAACRYEMQKMAYMAPQRPGQAYETGDSAFNAGIQNLTRSMANQPPSQSMFDSCMGARGWVRRAVSVPTASTNSPDRPVMCDDKAGKPIGWMAGRECLNQGGNIR